MRFHRPRGELPALPLGDERVDVLSTQPRRPQPLETPKHKRERFLTDAEFTRLGQVLDEVSGNGSQVSAGAITTIRLLMLTRCRKSEIMTLPWKHVGLDRA